MAKVGLLVDTDVFIDYFNSRAFAPILESSRFSIYYTAVTRKELLAKRGQGSREREAILAVLKDHRLIRVDSGSLRVTGSCGAPIAICRKRTR